MNRRRKASRARRRRSRSRPAPRRAPANPSPEQIAARQRAEYEGFKRKLCDINFFWADCKSAACRRVRRCAGDPCACFERHWRPLPEDEKQWRRDLQLELFRTRNIHRAIAYANERLEARAAEAASAWPGAPAA